MPELPEVETIVRGLRSLIVGQRFFGVDILDAKLGRPRGLGAGRGETIETVERVGKHIVLVLKRCGPKAGRRYLCVHLRMTGRLLWQDGCSRRKSRKDICPAHLRAQLRCSRGRVFFVDPRRFGTIQVLDDIDDLASKGVEPLSHSFTPEVLSSLMKGSRAPLKAWLLRQDRIAGIGNIYASEILHRAGLHPERRAGTLSSDESERLFTAVRDVLRRAIRNGGTTLSDFQDARGRTGRHQRSLAVYDREGEPCRSCGERIIRLVQGGRSTFYCPCCQR